MTPDIPVGFADALQAIPEGRSTGWANSRRYVTSKQLFNGGRSVKLVAEELGGADYISLNFYDLTRGARLSPCEMPAAKVARFVMRYRPEP